MAENSLSASVEGGKILDRIKIAQGVSKDCEHCKTLDYQSRHLVLGNIRKAAARNCIKCTIIRDAIGYQDADLKDDLKFSIYTNSKSIYLEYSRSNGNKRKLDIDNPLGSFNFVSSSRHLQIRSVIL